MRVLFVALVVLVALVGVQAYDEEYAPRRYEDAAGGWESARFREMQLDSEESSEESSGT